MKVTLRKVELGEREILANLLEKFYYEFSQYTKVDVNNLGLYGYQYLDCYWWEGQNRFAYFIEVSGKLAGFIMINDYHEFKDRKVDFVLSEFFVMYKYRRSGIGKEAFLKALELHKGTWCLSAHPRNENSIYFWNSVVNGYSNGNYEVIEAYPNTEFDDGTLADVFFFDNIEAIATSCL